MSNKGIIQYGGVINAGQLAVGDQASVHVYGAREQAELSQRLEALLREIHAADLPARRRTELVGAVEGMKQEARSPKPSKTTLESGLSLVEKAASSVSGVAAAVKVVQEVVSLLFF